MMSNLNRLSNGPQLVWVVEPETKIRFRYESEGGSHGGLVGKGGKKTYPTLKLINYRGRKKILVRVGLYTEDKKEHVLHFKGKKYERSKHYIEEALQDDNTVVFKNLQILSKKKDEIAEILMERKLSNLREGMTRVVRNQFEQRYTKEVKERAKAILNSVRLYFEVFENDKPNVPLCTLFSNVICNQKAASKGDLRISRLSRPSGSWRGGDEVFLLCDKVQKESIKVRFYENDEDGTDIWEDYGLFSPVDVHYQVAIVFKTPPYRRNVEKTVLICLERNGEMSDPRQFTYKPDENIPKKRKLDISQTEAVLFPEGMECSESASSMSVSSPECSNNATPGEIFEEMYNVPNDDSNPFNLLFLNDDEIKECFAYIDNASETEGYKLPFEDLNYPLDVFDGTFLFNEKDRKLELQTDGLIAPIEKEDKVDATKMEIRETILNQSLSLSNVRMNNLTLKEECDEFPKKELKDLVNVTSDEHKRKKCLSFFMKKDSHGNTLLHLAVLMNKNIVPILKICQAAKILNEILNARNRRNQTTLHLAVEQNRRNAAKILLLCGSNPNFKDCNSNNCYHLAAKNNLPDVLLEMFTSSKFLPENDFNDEGLTPAHVAIMQKNPCLFYSLKTHIFDVNVVDKKAGKSLLHYAVDFQPLILSELLEMTDIDIDIQDFDGNTPLHIACSREDIAAVRQLLQHGADPLVKNFKQDLEMLEDASVGQLPSDLTANIDILLLLKKAEPSADPDSLQEPDEITKKLCEYLDESLKWKKLATFFVDKDFLECLSLSPSPTKALLDYIKKQEQDHYKERLETALEFADLRDAISIMNE